jgi:hypothetical protein
MKNKNRLNELLRSAKKDFTWKTKAITEIKSDKLIKAMRNKTQELSELFNLNVEEITEGMNGYPSNTRAVLTDFESVDHLKSVREELESTGHDCTEILMHKKNGWGLWNYSRQRVERGMFRIDKDTDWTFDIDTNAKRKSKVNHVINELFGERPENRQEAKEIAKDVVSDLPENVGEITVFYDGDSGTGVLYWANDQTTGYYEDTNHYKIALLIESAPDQDEE